MPEGSQMEGECHCMLHMPFSSNDSLRLKNNPSRCVISGFCCGVNEIFAVIGFYTAQICSLLLTLWDWYDVPKMTVTNYQSMLRKIPEGWKSHPSRHLQWLVSILTFSASFIFDVFWNVCHSVAQIYQSFRGCYCL
jgi:hypothetical protein